MSETITNFLVFAVWVVGIYFSDPGEGWSKTDTCLLAILFWIIKIEYHIHDMKDKEQ